MSVAIIDCLHSQDELERQHERMRELQVETAKRISEERSNADRRYTYQVIDTRKFNERQDNNFLLHLGRSTRRRLDITMGAVVKVAVRFGANEARRV